MASRSANPANPVLSNRLGDPRRALGAAVTEQSAEEVDVFPDAEVGIEVLSQALRHKGDARADRAAMARIGHVAAQNFHPAVLDALGAGDEAQQRRLADAVRADHSDDAVRRNIERDRVEGNDAAISVADAFEADNRGDRGGHVYGFPWRRSGQAVLASNLTYAMPGNPVRTASAWARERSGSMRTLMRNISLSRSVWVSTILGVNCA